MIGECNVIAIYANISVKFITSLVFFWYVTFYKDSSSTRNILDKSCLKCINCIKLIMCDDLESVDKCDDLESIDNK